MFPFSFNPNPSGIKTALDPVCLLDGTGMRLMEFLRLRVKDVEVKRLDHSESNCFADDSPPLRLAPPSPQTIFLPGA